MMGRMTSTLSLIKLQKYSLFQKYRALSATCEMLEARRKSIALCYLEMWAGDRFSQLVEKWLLDLGKFVRIHNFEDIFDFVEEHDFLGAVDFRPIAK